MIRSLYHRVVPLQTRLSLRNHRERWLGKTVISSRQTASVAPSMTAHESVMAAYTTTQSAVLVGPKFEQAVRARYAEQNLAHHPMFETWFNYTIQTNTRGAETLREIAHYVGVSRKRFLDIGCAYAGTTLAFANAGALAVGVEISPYFLDLGYVNASDHPDLQVELIQGDILSPSVYQRLGEFDIITCENVIEHVDNVDSLLEILARLLSPLGICHLTIPNPFSYNEVRRDGHYGLFGLTLLERSRAIKYFQLAGNTGEYGVGEYCYTYEDYLTKFRRTGFEVEQINRADDDEATVNAIISGSKNLMQEFDELVRAKAIPEAVQPDIEQALSAYLDGLERNFRRYVESTGEQRQMVAHRFIRKYGQDAWRVIADRALV